MLLLYVELSGWVKLFLFCVGDTGIVGFQLNSCYGIKLNIYEKLKNFNVLFLKKNSDRSEKSRLRS